MKSFRKEKSGSILDRRLKAIEKEKAQLDTHIRGLARRAERPPPPPCPEPPRAPRITTTVPNPRAIQEPSSAEATVPDEDAQDTKRGMDHDLFSWSDKRVMNAPVSAMDAIKEEWDEDEEEEVREDEPMEAVRPSVPRMPSRDHRLASYLTTGSFSPTGYKRTPRPIQRTRLIFIGLVSIAVIFVVLKLLRVF
ncbi:MAG: hypothetical protein EOM20_01020 [Spartobacteria bacterium]|nr:hypothetical protein [Spartobacteria bacterium]